jgi:A/G-specific adenine glycosylase
MSDHRPTAGNIKAFQHIVLRFYRRHKRDLPWRRTRDPYRILVSEVMLQQTQVERVITKYGSFLSRFPTLRSLARARFLDVLRRWLGLGYNARALRLWRCARVVVRQWDGELPSEVAELERLPGIGPYTAAAVAAIAFGAQVPAIDVNVRRVLTRDLAGRDHIPLPSVVLLARDALPASPADEWTQALMDVGSIYCKATPQCGACPLRGSCAYVRLQRGRTGDLTVARHNVARYKAARCKRAGNRFAGSARFYRGRVMRALSHEQSLSVAALGRQVKEGFGISDAAWLRDLLQGLARDGLIRIDRIRGRVRLP